VIFLWDSLDSVITKGLLRMGHTPETSSLEDIIDDAEKVELIEGVGKSSYSKGDSLENGSGYRSKDRPGGRFGLQNGHRDQPKKPEAFKPSGSKWSPPRDDRGPSGPRDQRPERGNASSAKPNRDKQQKPRLSENQKNEYRAAGKCFECGETGHRSRDCPKKNSVKPDSRNGGPPGLSTHNMEFELVDMPEDAEDIFELSVNSINWYQDVEDTYYSDSQSGGSDAGSLDSRSDSCNSYRGQGHFDWNSGIESSSSDGSSMGVSEDEESFDGEPMDVDDKCPRCNGWESDCSCSVTSDSSSMEMGSSEMNPDVPEWANSVEYFLEIRNLYASSVIKYLRDSE
ncbi:hypothetical protein F5878DRAFT_648172, partial [Lentinula raphanica]